ncbi:hypothetical protein AVEN_103466-1 [Araneus ventricosus]|uniref:Uncharacterized protein n=1 Tax=Araneus ventricosus TaxID=182803 RepID=A0A4Y2MP99_ARAVE|nr:hypothetical protein AVEN_103466-1 [Araneus ventricosus]
MLALVNAVDPLRLLALVNTVDPLRLPALANIFSYGTSPLLVLEKTFSYGPSLGCTTIGHIRKGWYSGYCGSELKDPPNNSSNCGCSGDAFGVCIVGCKSASKASRIASMSSSGFCMMCWRGRQLALFILERQEGNTQSFDVCFL